MINKEILNIPVCSEFQMCGPLLLFGNCFVNRCSFLVLLLLDGARCCLSWRRFGQAVATRRTLPARDYKALKPIQSPDRQVKLNKLNSKARQSQHGKPSSTAAGWDTALHRYTLQPGEDDDDDDEVKGALQRCSSTMTGH